MNLTTNTFTRKNIFNVLLDGKPINAFESHNDPYFIIKVGPPGAGKSSSSTNNEILKLGIHPDDIINIDVDKITKSFNTFRNTTYKIRKNYNDMEFNNTFFNSLTKVHKNHLSCRNKTTNKSMKDHIDFTIVSAIKQQKHISCETTTSISQYIKNFGNMLRANKYKIVVFFYTNRNLTNLTSRILKRGENLYLQNINPYYRAYPLKTLKNTTNALNKNLTDVIRPFHESGLIENIIYLS